MNKEKTPSEIAMSMKPDSFLLKSTDSIEWAQEFIKLAKENNCTLEDLTEDVMDNWFTHAMDQTRRSN